MPRLAFAALALLLSVCSVAGANERPSPDEAREALERAGSYFRDHLGVENAYVRRYAADGGAREGADGALERSVGLTQPPGTPAVGAAFLRIFEATRERSWLDAAHGVAGRLVATQLLSGGWADVIETDAAKAESWCYLSSGIGRKRCKEIEADHDQNGSSLAGNGTQSVVNFLMWFDAASNGADPAVRTAIDTALTRLMAVQYRNGALPIRFGERAPGADEDVAPRASLPVTWPRDWQKPDDPPYFPTAGNVQRDTGRTLLAAYRSYGDPALLRAAMRIGDFLVAAQLPAPQQGWAQTYDQSLQPVWGGRFEPPAVASFESAGAIEYLIELFEATSKARYLEAARDGAKWLTDARLEDRDWARFYELRTNRPLYVAADGQLTYDDRDAPQGNVMKGGFGISPVFTRLRLAEGGGGVARTGFWVSRADEMSAEQVDAEAARLIAAQDGEGRWVENGWIEGRTFVDAVFVLARFVELSAADESE